MQVVDKLDYISMEHAKADSKLYVHRERDRRLESTSIQFPLLDSDFNIVRKDRRRISDRRKLNLKLIWQENQPIRNTSSLRLELAGQEYFFDTQLDRFSLGRSHQSDVRIDDSFVSKHHAQISYTDGEFVLLDKSLNGTFIETEDLGRIRVQGQKVYLFGEGVIRLGRAIDQKDQECIHFICS
jgi:hypothetical protein